LVFIRDLEQRTFGKRGTEEVLEKVLKRSLKPKHPVLKAVDLALDAYDIGFLIGQTVGESVTRTLPRDPSNAQDMELSFDPAKWRSSYTEWASPNDLDEAVPGSSKWYKSTTTWGNASFPAGQWDSDTFTGTLYGDIAAGWVGLNIEETDPEAL